MIVLLCQFLPRCHSDASTNAWEEPARGSLAEAKQYLRVVFRFVGRSGLGKSTLVNSLFLTDLYCDSVYPDPSERIPKTTEVSVVS